MQNNRSTVPGARVAASSPAARQSYQAPVVRSMGTVRGRTQWSPAECEAINLPFPCDDLLPPGA
jgi:hypothetical protein